MAHSTPTGTAAEVLAQLRDQVARNQVARNEEDRLRRNDARYRLAGTLLTDGPCTVPDSVLVKLRAAWQGDDQRLFDPAVLKLDGWTQLTTTARGLVWKGLKTCPPAPNPQDLPNSASPAERDWVQYLEKMADPKEWAKRQRRRAFLLGSSPHYSEWSREQDPVTLAKRAGPNDQGLFDPKLGYKLLEDDGWWRARR